MNRLYILSISSLFILSCSTGQLSFTTQFPSSSPVLSEKGKTELKKKIAIKNSERFTQEELIEYGVLEVEIK